MDQHTFIDVIYREGHGAGALGDEHHADGQRLMPTRAGPTITGVTSESDLQKALSTSTIRTSHAVLVCVGGAAGVAEDEVAALADLLTARRTHRNRTRTTPRISNQITHIVLAPGDSWGDEAPWLSAVATRRAC